MASGYTLEEARTRLATDWLDDANKKRWPNATLDRLLQTALTETLDDLYNETRAQRLRIEASVSSDSSGVIDLTALDPTPLHLVDLNVEIGDDRIPVYHIKAMNRERPDNTARDFRLYYVPDYQLPTNDELPLVGTGKKPAAGTWRGLEDLIILQAAVMGAARDPKGRPARQLREHRGERWARVTDTLTSRVQRFPPRRKWYPNLYWHDDLGSKQIVLSRRF